ncbi:MAG TPA: pyruvate kinase, partial [Thermoguttaceae bacterium]|nr:pyruvate kinase [Thermoguttaceae bacterium]
MTNTISRPTRPSQTKIVATLGPASSEQSQIAALLTAGVDVFRVNMAHGSRESHETLLAAIRAASIEVNQQVAVLVDLAGPKIRLGELPGGQLQCDADARLRFVRGNVASADPIELTATYEPLIDELAVGDRIMLADGTVALAVEQVDADYAECRVTQPGLIRSRQGVNLPGVKLSTPALGPVDRDNAVWAAQSGIDFVGLSFVRTAEEVRQLKA